MAYTKQGFKDGDTLYASNLIKIEDGVQNAEKIADGKAESMNVRFNISTKLTQSTENISMYGLSDADGIYRFSDISAAISAGKIVSVDVIGNEIALNGETVHLVYAGVVGSGSSLAFGFASSVCDGAKNIIFSARLTAGSGIFAIGMEGSSSYANGNEVSY